MAIASAGIGMARMQAAPEASMEEVIGTGHTVMAEGRTISVFNMPMEAPGLQEGADLDEADDLTVDATEFRDTWNRRYSRYCGCFEDTTKIPNKRFTYKKPHPGASAQPTMQVFSLKITELRVGLQWPLQVFGMVAIRDCVDQNRNIIFYRPRHRCQIVTQEDPYLKLTGPTRAVVVLDPATFEVILKVKGTTESEDQWLSFLAETYRDYPRLDSELEERDYASMFSELQFQLGSITRSVEATIEVRITRGSWPHGLRAQFTAGTASIPDAEIILLDSSDDELPAVGYIELSRCVASVEVFGQLRVCVKAFLGDKIVVNRMKVFKPKRAGVSKGSLSIDFNREISKDKAAGKGDGPLGVGCTFGFNISWSVISYSE